MYNAVSTAALTGVTFSGNAAVDGGGSYDYNSELVLTGVTFSGNTANNNGGGMYGVFHVVHQVLELTNVTFSDNSAGSYGGGIYSYGYDLLVNGATFSGNTAFNDGGGVYSQFGYILDISNATFTANSAGGMGGGLANDQANTTLTNVVFTGNSAGMGGGFGNMNGEPTLTGVTFWGNTASTDGGGIFYLGTPGYITNTIFGNNSGAGGSPDIFCLIPDIMVSYSLFDGDFPMCALYGLNNIVNQDPLLVDPNAGNFRLFPGSPAIDMGENAAPNLPATDLDGNPRIVNSIVDMGAYEFQATCPPDTVLYVDADATGANDGTSWADAFTELRTALKWTPVCPGVTNIWVAAGTYKPTAGVERDSTFRLVSGIAIYGGFAGTETSLSQRSWAANPTILSGDIGVEADSSDNSHHVVTGSGTDATAVLDGFTITKGYAQGSVRERGGGMINVSGNPTLANLVFLENYADSAGGGMQNIDSNPTLVNSVFALNSTTVFDGGGAGMANANSHPTLTNVTFTGNDAGDGTGGAIANVLSDPTLVNTILWGNFAATGKQPEIYNNNGSPHISYSLVKDSLTAGCIDGGNNVHDDPLFVDGPGGDVRLLAGSPAIDAGDNSAPNLPLTDLDGNPRIANGTVDMGAYEFHGVGTVSATPSPMVFAQVPGNQTTCDTLYIANTGGTSCTIAGMFGCDTAPFSMDTTLTVHTLAPGDTAKILVCVNPTVAGPDTAEVTIVSDAGNSPTTVQVRIDAVTAVGPDRTPKPFQIVSVSPNPFNPTTAVHFTLPEAMPVTAVIWSVKGERVRVLAKEERFEPGDNRIVWNGRTDQGTSAASGVYFIRIENRLGAKVARAVLLK
jgi:predicted outer membrane repeat protein